MDSIKISIIIPVYNISQYIGKCLDSIIQGKNIQNIEILCIDDGSTDGSGYICDKYAEKYSFIKVLHQNNKGVAGARNAGIQCAAGEYIAWVDGDDYVEPEWIGVIFEQIEKYKPDCFLFDYYIVNEHVKIKHSMNFMSKVMTDLYIYELTCDNKLRSYLWTHVIKRKYYFYNCFSSENIVLEDYDFLTKIAENFNNIVYTKQCLYNYVKRSNSLTNDISVNKSKLAMEIAYRRYNFFSKKNYKASKSGYWKLLIGYYNILIFGNNGREKEKIKTHIKNEWIDIVLSKEISYFTKIAVCMIKVLPFNCYKSIYCWYKTYCKNKV